MILISDLHMRITWLSLTCSNESLQIVPLGGQIAAAQPAVSEGQLLKPTFRKRESFFMFMLERSHETFPPKEYSNWRISSMLGVKAPLIEMAPPLGFMRQSSW